MEMSNNPRTPSSRRRSSPGEIERQKQIDNEMRRKRVDRKFMADKVTYRHKRRRESGEYENIKEEYPEWEHFSGKRKRQLIKNLKNAPIQTVPGIAIRLSAGSQLDRQFDKEFLKTSIAKLSKADIDQLEESYQNCDGSLAQFLESTKLLPICTQILKEFFRRKSSARGVAHTGSDEEQDGEDSGAEAPDSDSDLFDPNDDQEGPSTGPLRAPKRASRSQHQNGAAVQRQEARDQENIDAQMAKQADHGQPSNAENPCSVLLAITNKKWREASDLIELGCPLYITDDWKNTMNWEMNRANEEEEVVGVLKSLLKRGACLSDLHTGKTLIRNTINNSNSLLFKRFRARKFYPEIKARIEIKKGGSILQIPLNSVIAPLTTHGFIEPTAEPTEGTESGLLVCGMEFDPTQNRFVISDLPNVDIKVNGKLCQPNKHNIQFNNFELLSAESRFTNLNENRCHDLEVIMQEKTTKFLVLQLITYNLRT